MSEISDNSESQEKNNGDDILRQVLVKMYNPEDVELMFSRIKAYKEEMAIAKKENRKPNLNDGEKFTLGAVNAFMETHLQTQTNEEAETEAKRKEREKRYDEFKEAQHKKREEFYQRMKEKYKF